MRFLPLALASVAAASAALAGCKDDPPRRAPPPPPASSAKAGACEAGGGSIADATSVPFFPKVSGGFCVDPNGGDKAYGEGAPLPLDGICDLFDGECEVYKGYGVRRVVDARYVDGSGSPATIDVHLSRFSSPEGAYGMFTKRVVGDGDPLDEATPRPIPGGGAAGLGIGNAYLWRGPYLVELTYNDPNASEASMKAKGDALLPPLVKAMGEKIPGETTLPPAAARLPEAERVPMGIRYVTTDLLGVEGVGAGAFGYYKAGDKRFRVASVVRADVDQAKDVLATLGKQKGAEKLKNVGEGAYRLMVEEPDGVSTEWVFARSGKVVLGVGDEARALRPGMSADEVAKVSVPRDEKVERLKKLL